MAARHGYSDDMSQTQALRAIQAELHVVERTLSHDQGVYAPYAARIRTISEHLDRLDPMALAREAAAGAIELERYGTRRAS